MINLYLHAGSSNHGCEAIVRTTAAMLNKRAKLYSNNVDADLKYGIQELCDLNYDVPMIIKRNSVRWLLSAFQTKLTGKIDLYVKFQRSNFLKHIVKDDVCLSIGGDNYCYLGTEILAAINRDLRKRGAKTVLWGCSVEPEVLKNSEISKDIASFDLITARESISYEALKKINPNTVCVADPAFTLQYVMLPLPDNWVEGNMVGINASPLILQSGKNFDVVYKAYRMLIEEILNNTICGIALIPHVVCDENDDLTILSQLFEEYKSTNRVVLLQDHNCMELKGYIARCRFFIGARTHATIAAYSSCVPTLVLGYSVKSRGIANDLFGTEENYVLPVQTLRSPDELAVHFRWIMEHEDEIRTHLKEIMPEYISKAYLGKYALEELM